MKTQVPLKYANFSLIGVLKYKKNFTFRQPARLFVTKIFLMAHESYYF